MSSGYSGEGSAAANWVGAQFAGRLVKKLGNIIPAATCLS